MPVFTDPWPSRSSRPPCEISLLRVTQLLLSGLVSVVAKYGEGLPMNTPQLLDGFRVKDLKTVFLLHWVNAFHQDTSINHSFWMVSISCRMDDFETCAHLRGWVEFKSPCFFTWEGSFLTRSFHLQKFFMPQSNHELKSMALNHTHRPDLSCLIPGVFGVRQERGARGKFPSQRYGRWHVRLPSAGSRCPSGTGAGPNSK